MPNLAQVLKDEIRRLARSELRQQISGLKSSNAALKRSVAELKRTVTALTSEVRALREAEKRVRQVSQATRVASGEISEARFTPKGIRRLREKLGISQAELAALVGVSAQAVYIWENKDGRLRIRDGSKIALHELRQIGAREARRRLEQAG